MNQQTLELEIHDQPDALVRIMQVIHRRGGHIRELKVSPGRVWATVSVTVQDVGNPTQMTRALEKLVDVRRARFTTPV